MRKIGKTFLTMLQLQLFLTIVSLLIIVHWGLPLSYLAPLGNIIFSPLLTGFLLLSSLIFFFELLGIPNSWLICFLEILTKTWSNIMSLADQSCIVNLSKPSLFFTLCATISTFAILQCKYLRSPLHRIGSFTILLMGMLWYLGYSQIPHYDFRTISLGKKSIQVMYVQGTITIVDQGGLSQHACTRSWIEFTLLPFLRQTYASDIVSHLIIVQPTTKTFQMLNELCIATRVKNAYVPYWEGTTPSNLARAYFLARNSLEKQGKLHRIGKKNIFIACNVRNSIEIIPQTQRNKYGTINFPDVQVLYMFENKNSLE